MLLTLHVYVLNDCAITGVWLWYNALSLRNMLGLLSKIKYQIDGALLVIRCKYMQNALYARVQVLHNVHYHVHVIPSLYHPTPYLASILLQ